ncbi:alkaline phosphatase PafA [Dyadobacter tibetensis]|uniref:alkaline phosphatase PafA n=1 Tax=Dyadobacter tibetensis TaxID=1211851 RepID=UPI0035B5B360
MFLLVVCAAQLGIAAAQAPQKKASKPASGPKLVVGIVVDQMRFDYLYRYYDQYTEGGFKRMMNEGFNCRNNHYSYAITVTAAGHSSIYTGSVPAINGIVGNEWYDRATGQGVYCVDDSTVSTVGSDNVSVGKMSPRNLYSSTVTDQLRIASNFRSKVVGVSIKDRGSILPAGHAANASYWFDSRTGNWVTSTYYMDELPQWATDYNNKKKPAEYLRKGWQLLLPAKEYTQSTADDVPWEGILSGAKRPVFPYELAGTAGNAFEVITNTPWGNTLTKEMAIEAIKGENMGRNGETDFLAVSFSTPDKIGHRVGPNSIEQQDDFLKLDREFADLFNFLDSWVGKGEYTVFLSADHGVADVPGFAKANKLPGGLVSGSEVKKVIQQTLDTKFGKADYIVADENHQLYLNHDLLAEKGFTVNQVKDALKQALLPMDGIADIVNLNELNNGSLNGYQAELFKNNVHAKRSGDIQIIIQPGYLFGNTTGTSHGTPYNYDTQVPFVMFGWGVKKGETLRRTSVCDIAPTISALLKILPPSGNVGEPVMEALK